jgi:hypothetical protein
MGIGDMIGNRVVLPVAFLSALDANGVHVVRDDVRDDVRCVFEALVTMCRGR